MASLGEAFQDDGPEIADVGRLARKLAHRAVRLARTEDQPLRRMLLDHLGPAAATLPGISDTFPLYEQVNLQPAIVVVEDVDLIAEERTARPGQHPLLFQLLNEMEGLNPADDVTFLLTTNRADLLEPALAARPGRVDLAAELPLPDADARRALLRLYQGSLVLDSAGLGEVVERGRPGRPGSGNGRRDPGQQHPADRSAGPAARQPVPADPRPARRPTQVVPPRPLGCRG